MIELESKPVGTYQQDTSWKKSDLHVVVEKKQIIEVLKVIKRMQNLLQEMIK